MIPLQLLGVYLAQVLRFMVVQMILHVTMMKQLIQTMVVFLPRNLLTVTVIVLPLMHVTTVKLDLVSLLTLDMTVMVILSVTLT